MFSKKATKIDEIFTVDLTVTTYCQMFGEDFVNFVAFSENVNFMSYYVEVTYHWKVIFFVKVPCP